MMVVPIPREPVTEVSDSCCPLCCAEQWVDAFPAGGPPVSRCRECGLTRMRNPWEPPPYADEGMRRHEPESPLRFLRVPDSPTEQEASTHYCDLVEAQGVVAGSVLALVPSGHPLPGLARKRGHTVDALFDALDAGETVLPYGVYDAAVIVFQLERASEP